MQSSYTSSVLRSLSVINNIKRILKDSNFEINQEFTKEWHKQKDLIKDFFDDTYFINKILAPATFKEKNNTIEFFEQSIKEEHPKNYQAKLEKITKTIFYNAISSSEIDTIKKLYQKLKKTDETEILKVSIKYGAYPSFLWIINTLYQPKDIRKITQLAYHEWWEYRKEGFGKPSFLQNLLKDYTIKPKSTHHKLTCLIKKNDYHTVKTILEDEHFLNIMQKTTVNMQLLFMTTVNSLISIKEEPIIEDGVNLLFTLENFGIDFSSIKNAIINEKTKKNEKIYKIVNSIVMKQTMNLLDEKESTRKIQKI